MLIIISNLHSHRFFHVKFKSGPSNTDDAVTVER